MCMTFEFEPRTLRIACCLLNHYATSVNFLVVNAIKVGLYTLSKTFSTHGRPGWSGGGSRAAPRSGHDVTGPDINLDYQEFGSPC